ncbi:CaiB/BaiF CoA transferase family protein [Mycolicibacterium litorale]|uniref:CoA transferase n=2 Tax=Mycolicibacterium litorale TaxID=758802 RepID=A0AAD1MUL7_9MYCO|nr:CoA transferase [Mycolicibacterium litorale]MCV7418381.1 CoA transferase [Mycolicibacterium litorale]TDY06222.1 crotonobetainyl-CoA:carnitine CoA-transferase CaiB-like acyl-CoA transferase [Mycolicibacterium litorale]BBY19634.1 CoA transferase [Mycolicibacterium litorale]
MVSGPLAGVRVVDLTAMVMGPYCTQIMADMGADVVKVEPPEGDNTRFISVGPAPGMSGVFVNVNRGKRSVVLDLRTDDGKAALRALIAGADVFIHSMRAKAIAKLGFAYADVAALNPNIVYTNCYGYGHRGPDRDLPAYDDTIQAECGIPAVQEQLTGEANYVGTIMADKVAGLTALYATMMALFHRERTGEGQEVEVAMFETLAAFMLVEHANGAMFDPPLGPAVYPRTVAPNRRPYETKDGYIAVLIYNDKHWNAFVNAVSPVWNDELYATLERRAKQIDTVYGLVAETLKERTTDEWLALFRELEIPAAPIQSPDALFDHPHLNAVGMFETVDSPHGPVRFPGVPTWFSSTPGHVHGPAPELGADTAAVLNELGLPRAEPTVDDGNPAELVNNRSVGAQGAG